MVNTSDSIRLIEDSVIHPSVLLILIRFFKKTIKLYCIPKDKSRVKKPKHFIQNWVSIYWIPSTHPRIPRGFNGKESACQAANPNSIPELGKSPGGGNGNPLHYSCLKNPMERGAWQAAVHGVAKSRTQLSDWAYHTSYKFRRHWS